MASDFNADPATVEKALRTRSGEGDSFGLNFQDRRALMQPFFVVVPGILGSRLYKDGKEFWGTKGIIGHQNRFDLEFTGVAADAEILNDFRIIGYDELDFYRTLIQHLKVSSRSGAPHMLAFGYDWRQDIRKVAEKLDQQLRGRNDLKDRELVFIAHSMGGLVVTWWYHAIYSQQPPGTYTFQANPKVFFLGTPHRGSAVALFTLVEGYAVRAPWLIQKIANYLMKDLNDVGYSFFSIYQLLPFDRFAVTYKKRGEAETHDVNLFDEEIWRDCGWAHELLLRQPKELQATFYTGYLRERLDAADEFNRRMIDFPPVPNSVCFYSDQQSNTPYWLRIEQKRDETCEVKPVRQEPGDGSVVAEVGWHQRKPHSHARVQRLQTEHGDLPKHSTFLEYVDELKFAKVVDTVMEQSTDPRLSPAFSRERALLPLPIDFNAIDDERSKAILAFNRTVLRRVFKGASDAALCRQLYADARRAGDRAAKEKNEGKKAALRARANRLYALAIAFDRHSETAVYAVNNMADNLLNVDRWHDALPYLRHGLAIAADMRLNEPPVVDHLHHKLGVVLAHLGLYLEAREAYKKSKHPQAQGDLQVLEQNIEKYGIEQSEETATASSVNGSRP